MAGPITHIFLALQVLAGPLKGTFNEVQFLVGTSFPDIRYLGVLKRDQTHFDHVTFDTIRNEKDSFKAGMLFHSFVDHQREEFIVKNNIHVLVPEFKFASQTLKLAEDHLTSLLFKPANYAHMFDAILPQEQLFDIPNQAVEQWHALIKGSLMGTMQYKDALRMFIDINKPNTYHILRKALCWYYSRKVDIAFTKLMNNKKFKDSINHFYLNFNDLCN